MPPHAPPLPAVDTPAASPNPFALQLGHAGLLPFVFGAALVWLTESEERYYVAVALVAYAALIVSFLGGIHWGLGFRQALPSPVPFAWGVAPALLGWLGAMLQPGAGLVVLGTVLLLSYLVDRRLYPGLGAARWLTLRFRLSAVAALCCFLAAAGF